MDIVAFLNSDGGDIVIGVDDDGNILGITKSEFETRFFSVIQL